MISPCHPLVEVKTPFMGSELVWVILNEDALLFTNLLHDRSDIVAGELFSPFQDIEDLVSPHTLIDTAVLIEVDTVRVTILSLSELLLLLTHYLGKLRIGSLHLLQCFLLFG